MAILIIAGEHSGDIYGKQLAKAIKTLNPSTSIYGIGGNHLKQQCDHFITNITHKNSIGIFERKFLSKTPPAYLTKLEHILKIQTFSVAIIIDFQHENFKIAALLQSANVPIVTFITPNFWMWNDVHKMKKLAGYSRDIITIFKTEYDRYSSLHPRVHFFGHPIKQTPATPIRERKKIIALFPGSRKQEVQRLVPILLKTCQQFSGYLADYDVHLCVSVPEFKQYIENQISQYPSLDITLREDSNPLIKEAQAMISCTGTATLEAVAHNTPVIILGVLHPLTYFVAKFLLKLKLPYVGLPNIIMNMHRVPELVQSDVTPENIIQILRPMLAQPEKALEAYPAIQAKTFSKQDVFEETAKVILS